MHGGALAMAIRPHGREAATHEMPQQQLWQQQHLMALKRCTSTHIITTCPWVHMLVIYQRYPKKYKTCSFRDRHSSGCSP